MKEIIRLATSGFSTFAGGPEANGYVRRYGLEVIPLARARPATDYRSGRPTPAPQRPVRTASKDHPQTRDLDEVIVQELLGALRDFSQSQPPGEFPRDPDGARQPGLYSWWADEQGREQLAHSLGAPVPQLIYAGLAGATKWPSGREGTATLYSRIRSMHLSTNLNFSTLRMTLAALLREQLGLRRGRIGRLDGSSEARLTEWMDRHLRVVAVPYTDRRTLGAVEDAVLRELDPPLNLNGMPRTPPRARLTALRSALVRDLARQQLEMRSAPP